MTASLANLNLSLAEDRLLYRLRVGHEFESMTFDELKAHAKHLGIHGIIPNRVVAYHAIADMRIAHVMPNLQAT
jgi:hypothetical protein